MRRFSLFVVGVVGLVVVGGLGFVRAQQQAQPISVDCAKESLQKTIDRAAPNVEITVTGTCKENLYIAKDLTLRGPGATLSSPNPHLPVVAVDGKKVLLLGLTITGGDRGLVIIGKGAEVVLDHVIVKENIWSGVLVTDGKATIRNSVISANGVGIAVLDRAEISNNTIRDNRGCGVWAVDKKLQNWAVDAVVTGKDNTLSNNAGGDLCPAGLSWPQGFKK